jgi:hypothetical protein
VAADVRPGPGLHVAAGQAGELAGPQPGLGGEGEEGVVAAAVPGPGVRGGEQGRGFVGGEIGDGTPAVLLRGDREDPGDRPGVLGVAEGGELEERPDRGQAGVPGACRVAAVLLQVGEEAADQPGVEGGDVEAVLGAVPVVSRA